MNLRMSDIISYMPPGNVDPDGLLSLFRWRSPGKSFRIVVPCLLSLDSILLFIILPMHSSYPHE